MKFPAILSAILAMAGFVVAAAPAQACALSGMSGDCAAACHHVAPGWMHTTCIISARPPAAHKSAR